MFSPSHPSPSPGFLSAQDSNVPYLAELIEARTKRRPGTPFSRGVFTSKHSIPCPTGSGQSPLLPEQLAVNSGVPGSVSNDTAPPSYPRQNTFTTKLPIVQGAPTAFPSTHPTVPEKNRMSALLSSTSPIKVNGAPHPSLSQRKQVSTHNPNPETRGPKTTNHGRPAAAMAKKLPLPPPKRTCLHARSVT